MLYPDLRFPTFLPRAVEERVAYVGPLEDWPDLCEFGDELLLQHWQLIIGLDSEWDMVLDGLGPFEDLDRFALDDDHAPRFFPFGFCHHCRRERPYLVQGVREANVRFFCRRCLKPARYRIHWADRARATRAFGPRLYTPYIPAGPFLLHRPARWSPRYWVHRLLGTRLYVTR